MVKKPQERKRDPGKRNEYEPPAIIFQKKVEAVANTCNFDPPLTKETVPQGCTGLTFS